MTLAVILSVAVSLTLLGASLLLRDQVQLATGQFEDQIQVSIFLCDGRLCPEVTPEQRANLQGELEGDPLVELVIFESKQEAYENFKEAFKNDPELVATVTPDTLPASFRVKLINPEEYSIIKARFEAWPGVESIVDQGEVLEEIFSIINVFQQGAIIVAVIQLIAASVLIANTIRVAAFARREQTSIMKLVGASNWYIRLPFVLEGVIAGTIGAAVSWVLLLVAIPRVTSRLTDEIPFTPFIGLEEVIFIAPWLFGAGILIAATSSIVSLRRFLDV